MIKKIIINTSTVDVLYMDYPNNDPNVVQLSTSESTVYRSKGISEIIPNIGPNFYIKKGVYLDKELTDYTDEEWFNIVKSLNIETFRISEFNQEEINKKFIESNRFGFPKIMLISEENYNKYFNDKTVTTFDVIYWDCEDIIIYKTNEIDQPGFTFYENGSNYTIAKIGNAEKNFKKLKFI